MFFFVICFFIASLTVNQFAMSSIFATQALTNVLARSTNQNSTFVPSWLPYSSSSGTGVQDLSGLKRSIFINSLKLANPKSFS
jgi:hypothetical protein